MNDLISRQAALKELAVYIHLIDKTMGKGFLTDDDCMEAAKSVLGEGEIPAVQPERKRGEWIGHPIKGTDSLSIDEDTCSRCGKRFYQIGETGAVWNFCPSCGAYMGKGEPNANN